ncbi:MAG TPA: glycosyl transferase [Lachnospiraceae bacterium]|nr:glycosyl transferase [Lachnospiraceae bacterium]
MIHIFIVGSKGIPAQYGGFETFVENLTLRKEAEDIKYHVSCMNDEEKHFEHNGADCFNVRVPLKGAPGRIFHVSLVLGQVEKWCKSNPGETVIVYILGCRIGPLLIPHARRLHKLGVKICCNPDGLEWKRDKWNAAAKKFLRYCESCLVRYSDLAICDAANIEKYIRRTYREKVKETTFIAYGADVQRSGCSEEKLEKWYQEFEIRRNQYYLIVGRFVPENNYETMVTEFMKSKTSKDLVIITNVEKNKFYAALSEKTGFDKDKRIKFVGTVYEQELLKKIREQAYGYVHGHEVGGTNPSLLEALASTKVNLLLEVGFNKEVGADGAFYWNKEKGNLAALIEKTDELSKAEIEEKDVLSTNRVKDFYGWEKICQEYERIWEKFEKGT